MKTFTKILTLAAALAVSTSFAYADPTSEINFVGSDTFTSNSITFTGPGGLGAVDGTSTGLFSGFLALTPAYFSNIPNLSGFSGTELLVSTSDFVDNLDFYLTGVSDQVVGGFLLITGTGYFTESGFGAFSGDLPGTIAIDTQGTGNTTFSASADTTNVTPEPSGLLLLGTGLIGAAGFARRKFAAKFV
jgi:hypothetical protein